MTTHPPHTPTPTTSPPHLDLHHWTRELDLHHLAGPTTLPIADLTDDSREARPHTAFIARQGPQTHGNQYTAQALAAGANAIITTEPPPADLPNHVAWIQGPHIDQHTAGILAERFFDLPSQSLALLGITGTNGKTTTAWIACHLLNALKIPTGLLGTIAIQTAPTTSPIDNRTSNIQHPIPPTTTPGSIAFSRYLAQMRDQGCTAAIAEISSHALHQRRTDALHFNAAVFTNLTGDHLDYHPTMHDYAAAKARLFAQLPPDAPAILNADDPYAPFIAQHLADPQTQARYCRINSFKTDHTNTPAADSVHHLHATPLELTPDTTRATYVGPWGTLELTTPYVGRHNIANTLHALALISTLTDLPPDLPQLARNLPPVPGRLEKVTPTTPTAHPTSNNAHPIVLVDFAHTHDALENVLATLRPLAPARLVVLFGAGGDRDRTKRPRMAAVAAQYADLIYITSDNPRTEDPQVIIDQITAGLPADAPPHHAIPDRALAIQTALQHARPDDTILIAGKGHEDYQIVGHTKHPFDDRLHASRALDAWLEQHAPA